MRELFFNELFFKVIAFAIVYGWLEQRIKRQGFTTTGPRFFDYFSYYHVSLLVIFIIVAWPEMKYLPLMVLIEDVSFFLFYPGKKVHKGSWVNFNLGGIQLTNKWWLPLTYVLLFAAYVVLEILF